MIHRWLSYCILLILIFSGTLAAQEIKPSEDSIFRTRGEIYFRFQLNGELPIDSVTRMISIDNYKDGEITAYANKREFLRFLQTGIPYTVLPNPSSLLKEEDLNMGNWQRTPSNMTIWNFYPTYDQYISFMNSFVANYPSICKLETIGTTIEGRSLLALKISDSVDFDRGVPQVFLTSSIHGDEITGYVLMMHLIDSLLNAYGTSTRITNMIKNTQIYINPLANPDGTYAAGNNTVIGATRGNSNLIDMNRNYPDPRAGQHPDGNAWQPETVDFMNYAASHHFNLSINFHGGAEVVNYPWDTWTSAQRTTADDSWWQFVSKEYADTVKYFGPAGYFTGVSPSGYTNGGNWYVITGGRQDYHNYYRHCREVTLEISVTKTPAASTLLNYWKYNNHCFFNYIEQANYGINGRVMDSLTLAPLAAKVFISGFDRDSSHVWTSLPSGWYFRMIDNGTRNLTFSATGYYSKTISATATRYATTRLHVKLRPMVASPATLTATGSGYTQVDLAWTKNPSSDPVIIAYNTVNTFGTPVNGQTYIAGSSIIGGGTVIYSGPANAFSQLGLVPGTTYYYQAFSQGTGNWYSAPKAASATTQAILSPVTFTATAGGANQINLSWTKNASNDPVMIAFNTSSSFGSPVQGTGYSVNASLFGGGYVMYVGAGTSFSHLPLDPNTTYYYQVWSVATGNYYSAARTANATTTCGISGKFPLVENFTDATSALPDCWSQESSGTGATNSWIRNSSNNAGGSSWEMMVPRNSAATSGAVERLKTYSFNTTGISSVDLSFRYYVDGRNQGTGANFRVQTSSNGTTWTNIWTLASPSNGNIGPAQVNLTISNLSQPTLQIAFAATDDLSRFDYWYIDEVTVKAPGYWVGGTQNALNDWNTGPNWGDGVVPGATTDVYVPARLFMPIVNSTTAQCKNLVLSGTSTVTVAPGKSIQVNGNFTLQAP